MRLKTTSKKIILYLLLMCPFSINCSGGGDGNSSPAKIVFDLSDARGFVESDSSSSSSAAGRIQLATANVSDVETNLKKIIADGTLKNFIYNYEASDGNKTVTDPIKVHDFQISPVGDVFISFIYSVLLDDVLCDIVRITSGTMTASCMIESTDGDGAHSYRFVFDQSGNAYFEGHEDDGEEEDVYKWTRETGVITHVLEPSAINFEIWNFHESVTPIADGFLIDYGQLTGAFGKTFFRYYIDTKRLELLDDDFTTATGIESENINRIQFLSNGNLYIITEYGLVKATLEEDNTISFERIGLEQEAFGVDMSSSGEVYATYENLIKRIEPTEGAVVLPALDDLGINVVGDFIFYRSNSSDGNTTLIRKPLALDGEEVDILGGRNILIQSYDVTDDGDVYLAGLDLDTTTVYFYKYNNTTSELEQLESLDDDISEILLF